MTDVQALAETVREGLSKVQALDGQVCRCPSCVNAAERLAALDELVLEHTRQEAKIVGAEAGYAALRDKANARPPDTEVRDTYADGFTAGLIEAIWILNRAALSPPPVASGETGQ